MPQMFDWIFFAIVLPVPAYLVWDWYKNRDVPEAGKGLGH
jgi:hypothetical protein